MNRRSREHFSPFRLVLYFGLLGWGLLWASLVFNWHLKLPNTTDTHHVEQIAEPTIEDHDHHQHQHQVHDHVRHVHDNKPRGEIVAHAHGGQHGDLQQNVEKKNENGQSAEGSTSCEARTRAHFQQYAAYADASAAFRHRHGPLRIAAFSRLWPPPLHGRGGMQYHAQHLYSQLAARGHYVHVFATGPPEIAHCQTLFFAVNPVTNELKEVHRARGNSFGEFTKHGGSTKNDLLDFDKLDSRGVRLVVQQVPSARNSEYSVPWYNHCLAQFTNINASLSGVTRAFPPQTTAGAADVNANANARGGQMGEEDVEGVAASKKSRFQNGFGQRGFDVVHSESWAAVANMYQLGLPFAVTWHGSMLDWFRNEINLIVHNFRMKGRMPGENTAGRMKSLGNSVAFEAYALLAVPNHIVISDSAAADLADLNLIDPSRVHLIYNGVNPSNFRPDRRNRIGFLQRHAKEYLTSNFESLDRELDTEVNALVKARKENGLDPEQMKDIIEKSAKSVFVVGCGGRLEGIKGHHQLSEAMARVLTQHKNVVLLVAGSGPEQRRYQALKTRGLKVVLLGMLPQEELGQFYQSLDVFIDPFYQHHGLNTVMIEAVLSGVPLIATGLASAKTTVPCDAYGRTFALGDATELADKIVELKSDPIERAMIGQRVRERAVSIFTSSTMAARYERVLYDAVLRPTPLTPLTGSITCKNTYPAMCLREPGSTGGQ